MSTILPKLRQGLDIMPSPVSERPGLLIRDPYRYTNEILIIPPLLASGLVMFDGESTILDMQAQFSRLVGQLVPAETIQAYLDAMQQNGFLETQELERMQAGRHAEFAAASTRPPVHSGTGYAETAIDLGEQLSAYLRDFRAPASERLIGLAAPHVSPWGGWQSYAAAYGRLSGTGRENAGDRTIVILGTSHYGEPEKFGLTRKSFKTPLGTLQPDIELIDRLEKNAGDAVLMEDYCHAIEHSIEFQCIFLQHMLGSEFRILPILCGPFVKSMTTGEAPERDDNVYRFFDSLGELADQFSSRLFWVLGIDLAHVGRRYGDDFTATTGSEEMAQIEMQDRERLDQVCDGNAGEFFELMREEQARLKWCGYSPIYTFLQAMPEARGNLIRYDQWNIDEQSVVSFAAMEFRG
ncbi:MAG: AmmeMemoRadiSam system protein B [Acidobacteria bacterium]|nr:AmmeMemoRadiSam system protein B [Acidobacteriota bacterium]